MERKSPYHLRECRSASCRFRYPMADGEAGRPGDPDGSTVDATGARCPRCGSETLRIDVRRQRGAATAQGVPSAARRLDVLLDNVRSVFNVGSIFRTADGVGVRHIHLCGVTPTPEHEQFEKTALGASRTVSWTWHPNGVDAVRTLKARGSSVWALESDPRAEQLFEASMDVTERPVVLVLGGEKLGVDPDILFQCDRVFFLPMLGVKDSLNVAVAVGVALYHLTFVNPRLPGSDPCFIKAGV